MCPLLNIVVDIRTSEKSESGNWHLSECKLGTKCKCLRKHQNTTKRRFLLRVVATQIPNTYFLSSLSNLEDEISFKGGSL
jgi:hypothetical protein